MTNLIGDSSIDAAAAAIAPHVQRTPTVRSVGLSETLEANITAKLELLQPTGSFKVRGAFNTVLAMSAEERSRGLISMSAGNHALAVAHVARHVGVPATVCMPATAVQFKIDAVRALGANLELVEGDLVARTNELRDELGASYVHPFDHAAVVAGTATIGREIMVDDPDTSVVIVPVGGGGLISGVATGVKSLAPHVRVIGVEPEAADVVSQSRDAGEPISLSGARSIADGLAAPITGQINLDHINTNVDELVRVSEDALHTAWGVVVRQGKFAAEPAAAAGVASVLAGTITLTATDKVCIVLSGGNADFSLLRP
ncbi:MAG: pyridoxal-phosphate dependent enzyme [Actinomycetota bacterium]|nr:pyridoxal-phosphate dependent enzyme [Actinomycetota bacterium]